MESVETFDRHRFDLKGKTAEAVVHELAYRSFLREWCYPNPRDKGGKEICDLLVNYDGTILIVSVKNVAYSGNFDRYQRKAFEESTKQILGAERRLMGGNPPPKLCCPVSDKSRQKS